MTAPLELFASTCHLITVPTTSSRGGPSVFAVQILHMQDSYHVWAGLPTEEQLEEAHRQPEGMRPPPTGSSKEDDQDGELQEALRAAGRHDAQQAQSSTQVAGAVAQEWAVAMAAGSNTQVSSLFRTSADLASSMAQRIARKLNVRQIHLSLDVPPELTPSAINGINAPSHALLLLEKGIVDCLRTSPR